MGQDLSDEHVSAAFEAAKNLDRLIRNLQFISTTELGSESERRDEFDELLSQVTLEFEPACSAIYQICPILQSSQTVRYGLDVHPSMHFAILNCADHIRRKPSKPDSYKPATEGFMKIVGSMNLPDQHATVAQLWNERQATAATLPTLQLASVQDPVEQTGPASLQPAGSPAVRGVSLRDVAIALATVQGDYDPSAINQARVRWNNTKLRKKPNAHKLPEMLGKCAADNKSGLFGPSAILEFVQKEDGLLDREISEIRRHLRVRTRPVKNS